MSDLLLDVSQMREARALVDRTLAPEALPADSDVFRIQAPVRLRCEVRKDRQQYRLMQYMLY